MALPAKVKTKNKTKKESKVVFFLIMSCSLIGKTPFFGSGLYQFESGQLSLF